MQLLTVLVRLEEVPAKQVRDVYKLLLDDSYAVRHAAAELVTDMLEESGQRHLAQVLTPHPVPFVARFNRKHNGLSCEVLVSCIAEAIRLPVVLH